MSVMLRRLMTWLLLAALPWQGVAASAMVLCQPATQSALAGAQGPRMALVTEQASHHGHHGNDAHDAHGDPLAAVSDDPGTGPGGHGLQADSDHHCSACSMCSHALALPETPVTLYSAGLPEDLVAGPLLRPGSRVTALPDKPPRA
jgi:hypothetical protein